MEIRLANPHAMIVPASDSDDRGKGGRKEAWHYISELLLIKSLANRHTHSLYILQLYRMFLHN